MQYRGMTLRCLKQCSACVFPEICFLFEILCMQKKKISNGILWGPFVEWKTKETFCFAKRWSHYNTLISQVDEVLNGPDLNLFCPDPGPIRHWSIFFFFFVLFLYMYFSQKPGYLLKKELHIERKSANRFIFVSLWLNCRFNSLESGVDRYFSQNCDVCFWREKQ